MSQEAWHRDGSSWIEFVQAFGLCAVASGVVWALAGRWIALGLFFIGVAGSISWAWRYSPSRICWLEGDRLLESSRRGVKEVRLDRASVGWEWTPNTYPSLVFRDGSKEIEILVRDDSAALRVAIGKSGKIHVGNLDRRAAEALGIATFP